MAAAPDAGPGGGTPGGRPAGRSGPAEPAPGGGGAPAEASSRGGDGHPAPGTRELVRIRLVEEFDGSGEADLLRLALQQAVGALGGYGGLAHLSAAEGLLRLVAVSGLPGAVARRWEDLSPDTATAPARAVTRGTVCWSAGRPPVGGTAPAAGSASGGPRGPDGRTRTDGRPRAAEPPAGELRAAEPPAADPPGGVVAAPVVVGGIPVGALAVLTGEPPDAAAEAFLARLARTVGERLPHTRRPYGGSHWWQEPTGVRGQVMQQISAGTWSWDLRTGVLDIDETAETLLPAAGLDPATWNHRIETWMSRVHPDDRPSVEESVTTALAGGQPYAVEYRIVDAEGAVSWVELRAVFEHDEEGRAVRLSGTAWNVTDRRSKLTWLAGLFERHPDPIHVLDAEDRVEWANRAARALGRGGGAEVLGRIPWETVPEAAEQGVPLLAAARAAPGKAVSTELTYEDPGGAPVSWLVRAVDVGGFVATQMADITERKAAETARAERTRRMIDLNGALIRALDTREVIDAITAHVLPMVAAEGLIVHDLTGGGPQLVAVAGYTADYRAELEAPGMPQRFADAVGSDGPRFYATRDELEAALPGIVPLARHGGKHAWAALPLIVSDRRVGSCVISWPAPHDFSEHERSLLGTIAVIIGQSLAKARMYENARHRAERLQQELLPGGLPPTTGVRARARYRPAEGEEVGGDWYDTIALPGARSLAVIGDVRGHGLEQAIAMGIIRHAALTVASLDLPVDEVMAHLNDAAARLGPLTATCMLVLYDATTGACRFASAGHPPPVLLTPGGEAHEMELPCGQPLGQASVPAPVSHTPLPEGSVLVLYSDGLLDGDTRDVRPLTGLVTRYAAAAPLPRREERRDAWLDTLCDTIGVHLPAAPHREDDAALMTLALGRVPAERIAVWDLPFAPETAGRGRALASERIAAWGLGDLTDTALLVVSELIGNAVRHAVGIGADVADHAAGHLRLRLLRLPGDEGKGDEITCEVYDGSQATPRVRHPLLDDEFGRGLQLVAVTARRWGTRYTEGGKCIWATVAGAPGGTA
ncbi:SpoIIE family protein phosphatase [Streptomyces sp. NPDC020983]|uniref:SpoIIE family protein phosphatase n=1 Tax=Streptomyces sp. NPDC020983 TaxID=3365106 RepID=UPI0037AEEA13